jgi:hypothetical protein
MVDIVEVFSDLYGITVTFVYFFPRGLILFYNYKMLNMLKLSTLRSVTIKRKVDGNNEIVQIYI